MSSNKLIRETDKAYLTQTCVRRACIKVLAQILLMIGVGVSCINTNASTIHQEAERLAGVREWQDVSLLTVGTPVKRAIVIGDMHKYAIRREAGRALHTVIESNVDLTVVVVQPDGRMDTHSLTHSPESAGRLVLLLAGPTGNYRFMVQTTNGTPGGRYSLLVEPVITTAPIKSGQPDETRRDEVSEAQRQKRELRTELGPILLRALEKSATPINEQTSQPEDTSAQSFYERYNSVPDLIEENARLYVRLFGADRSVLQQMRKSLPEDTTLLSYNLKADQPVVFVINSRTIIKRDIPASYKEISSTVEEFLGFASTSEVPLHILTQWYRWLISPIESDLEASNLGIIGDGALQHIPFAAITDGRQNFLSERFRFFYLPKLKTFSLVGDRRGNGHKRLLAISPSGVVGLPFLKNSSKEVNSIARFYEVKQLNSPDATKVNFLKLADKYQIIHIAAHAICIKQARGLSHIVMDPGANKDVALSVDEVAELTLNNLDLVVLSACETKVCGEYNAEAIDTLNDAFIAARARSVIASLWTVDDAAASLFMSSFYKHLKKMGKAEALAAAQKETRSQYPRPYYWAAFVLTGEPALTAVSKTTRF